MDFLVLVVKEKFEREGEKRALRKYLLKNIECKTYLSSKSHINK